MKRRRRIAVAFVALAMVGVFLLSGSGNRARRDLEATRRSLRQQGFKIDVSEFDLAASPEAKRRAAMLARTTWAEATNRTRSVLYLPNIPPLMIPAGKDVALVIWKLEKLSRNRVEDVWPELDETLRQTQPRLDTALQAAISGPIRFEPIGRGFGALLPYLGDLRQLETAFGLQTVVALHQGRRDVAWTNLLASTCLVTEYTPEPIDISHVVRFVCAALAFDAAWNALQSTNWTDAQLSELQRRWESVDFWSGLPETAAFSRANSVVTCERYSQEPLEMSFGRLIRAPREAWGWLGYYRNQLHYRHVGVYEDQQALLLYYRDRELELRAAMPLPTWSEMRLLPGITNLVPFVSKNLSPLTSLMNMRQMTSRGLMEGQGLLGSAASSEVRRRLIITAVALERFRARHGSYPETLPMLVPELLASAPVDFMDGKPLRYHCTDDGHFVLYSVGLDCADDGGALWHPDESVRPYGGSFAFGSSGGFGSRQGTDLVWPRPASAAEAEHLRKEQLKAEDEQTAILEEMERIDQWDRTARRQAKVEAILKTPPHPKTKAPAWRGRLLTEVLRNEQTGGTNLMTLSEMLMLHQVITGAEPETVTFEVSIKYDVLTNIGSLTLYIDPCKDDSDEGCQVGQLECRPATNGNCLLVWNTIFESPGKHALLAGLDLEQPERSDEEIVGPVIPFVLTNLCQFSLTSVHFQREHGVTLSAKLAESKGDFSVEFRSASGGLLKTISGATSDGFIKVHWDLIDDHGNLCTNASFDPILRLALPESGRAQTLRGP